MLHWYHRRAAMLAALFLLQNVFTSSAVSISPMRYETRSAVTFQRRAAVDVTQDNYFIPAIVASGVFVILALICCYWLGWCFNSQRMDRYYSRAAYPTPQTTSTNVRPTINLNADGTTGELTREIERRSSSLQRKAPSTQASSGPGSPVSVAAQIPPAGLQYPASNNWPPYGYTAPGQPPQMTAAPVSHGFQPIPQAASSIMSVQHLNPTATSYSPYYNRGHQQVQHPPTSQAPSQIQAQAFRPDAARVSTVSSADSSTQIGSTGEQVPYMHSPHQGNTLSYVSGTAPSSQSMPPMSTASYPPQDGSVRGEPRPQMQATQVSTSSPSGPPAYIEDGRGYAEDKKSRKKNG